MIPRLQLNGTEGTAICRVTVVNETNGGENMKPLQGCIVSSKDENLKDLIGLWKNPSDDQNIFSKHKYFFYSPNGEIITKQMKTTLSYPKIGDSTHHEKRYKLKRNLNAVVVNECHLFLLCESKELDKCSFLKKYRIKGIRLNQTLGNEVYGLGKDHFGFIKLEIEKCEDQPTSNEYKVQNLSDEEFKNLLDVPGPIIVDEQEGKTENTFKILVGSFVKVTGKSRRISCSVFEVTGKTTDRLGTSTYGSKVDGDSDSENKGGNEPSENADNFDGINPKSDTAKVNSSLEDVDDEIKNDDRGKNMKETSKFPISNSFVLQKEKMKQEKQYATEKLEESNRQLRIQKLEEDKRQLEEDKRYLQQKNEMLEEDKRQLEEDKRQLQKQLDKKQEEDKRYLQQKNEMLEEDKRQLEEDKRQLQKQLQNEKLEEDKRQLEEDKRQLQKQLNEKQEEDKRSLQQKNEKLEDDKRQLQKQLDEKQEEDKKYLQQKNEKLEDDKRQLQKQLDEKQEEEKRYLQQKNEKLEEDKRQLEVDKRQLQKQLDEKQEEDKKYLQQKNEKLEEDKRQLEEDKRQLQKQLQNEKLEKDKDS